MEIFERLCGAVCETCFVFDVSDGGDPWRDCWAGEREREEDQRGWVEWDLRFNFTLGCLRSVFFFGNLAFLVARV